MGARIELVCFSAYDQRWAIIWEICYQSWSIRYGKVWNLLRIMEIGIFTEQNNETCFFRDSGIDQHRLIKHISIIILNQMKPNIVITRSWKYKKLSVGALIYITFVVKVSKGSFSNNYLNKWTTFFHFKEFDRTIIYFYLVSYWGEITK